MYLYEKRTLEETALEQTLKCFFPSGPVGLKHDEMGGIVTRIIDKKIDDFYRKT